jgi:hypothetical protein
MDIFTTITNETLAGVTGGMNIDDLPESTNIEDRRGETWWQSLKRRWTQPRPEPFPPPDPNSKMAKELGIDDIDRLGRPPVKR